MDDELSKLIDDELNSIEPSFEDIYNSSDGLDEKIKNQNEKVKYKADLIKALKRLQEENFDVKFDSTMSIEELEEILNNVVM